MSNNKLQSVAKCAVDSGQKMLSDCIGETRNTAHDWEMEKRRSNDKEKIYDDGTMTFFWRAHRITVLAIFACLLLYVALFDGQSQDIECNTKRGLVAVVLAFVLFGVTHTPDGPFRRPHPAFWRLVLCLSIVYELALVFLLFQNVHDARHLLKNVDESLGEPLPEKSYGGNCRIRDEDRPDDPYHNLWDKMDGFVTVHFFGWWLKTLVLRDYWLCMVISIMFELLEYSLEHQLANFSECWWDHWIMDALICNGLGIYLGMMTLEYLSMKPYHWRGMWNIPTYRGKFTRILKQFTPYSWTDFDWRPTSSLKRWVAMLGVITMFLLAELNTFYLKLVLWIPPPHFLCLGRLFFFLFVGAVSMREVFQFLDDPQCKKFGTQSWLCMAIIITELLITVKFDWEIISKPLPPTITICWIIGIGILLAWTVWHFYLQRLLWHTEQVSRSASPIKHQLDNNNTEQLSDGEEVTHQTHLNGTAPTFQQNGSSNGHSSNNHRNNNSSNGNSPRHHLRSRAGKH